MNKYRNILKLRYIDAVSTREINSLKNYFNKDY